MLQLCKYNRYWAQIWCSGILESFPTQTHFNSTKSVILKNVKKYENVFLKICKIAKGLSFDSKLTLKLQETCVPLMHARHFIVVVVSRSKAHDLQNQLRKILAPVMLWSQLSKWKRTELWAELTSVTVFLLQSSLNTGSSLSYCPDSVKSHVGKSENCSHIQSRLQHTTPQVCFTSSLNHKHTN